MWKSTRLFTKLPLQRSINQIVRVNLSRLNQNANVSEFKFSKLVKPLVFTVSFCGSSFTLASIWKYENSRKEKSQPNFFRRNDKVPKEALLNQIRNLWNTQTDSFKMFCGIAIVNAVVFMCWRIPKCNPVMIKYFMSSIEAKSYRCLPMVLSNFSHFSLTHIGLNMFVLYSFANISIYSFGKEDFLALYLSSGVVSSFLSLTYKVAVSSLAPSLGASGAILGILGAVCTERPDIQLMIIFLPFYSFSSDTAIKGILLVDTLGAIFKWGFFDHAAHLGGTLFGILYAKYLRNYTNQRRSYIIQRWVELKQYF